ncbi:DUF1993 domain-containing protein [Luteibacter pinisoli]|uniref:DUF1993 domain-containing protein n=1 Tax=Luteibacter pinisoli TaxID=2589080 RepID=A0A4Y5Z3B6_9GAMM|nr:DUF1993 domain-containing protein [Luteibacter pinisoli]QDE39852.1 DUF1993 domain-containing protein [Luteibacter pinisoli]
MSLTLFDITIPVLLRGLDRVDNYLKIAEAHCEELGFDPAVLIQARLAPDMLTLAGQVQRASDTSKGCAARLSGKTAPVMGDTESTFAELFARVDNTRWFIRSVSADDMAQAEEKTIQMSYRSVDGELDAKTYVLTVVLPNFFFHISTLHGILRARGLEIGKRDYFGPLSYIQSA